MPQFRFNGAIKAITFKDARVSVLLTDTTFLSNEGDWKQWVDWKLVESGKYKKGEVWVSAFEQSAPEVYQACKIIEKGSEVEVEIFKTEKGFLNINNIQLKVPEVDVNDDLPRNKQGDWRDDTPDELDEPSSEQRPEDSPEAQAEKLIEEQTRIDDTPAPSTTVDTKDTHIIRECCIKAVGAMVSVPVTKKADIVALAKRLETFVLTGK